jgi:hypothetical protein
VTCGECGKPGELMCCEGCTRAFHPECLGLEVRWRARCTLAAPAACVRVLTLFVSVATRARVRAGAARRRLVLPQLRARALRLVWQGPAVPQQARHLRCGGQVQEGSVAKWLRPPLPLGA